MVEEIISANPSLKVNFKAGNTRLQGFVMGQLMKKTQGKINPSVANKIIVQELNK